MEKCSRSNSIGPSGVWLTTIPWWPQTTPQPDPSLPSSWAWVPDAEGRQSPSLCNRLLLREDGVRRPPNLSTGKMTKAAAACGGFFVSGSGPEP